MHEKIGNEELHVLEFCQAVGPILEQVNKFRKQPVSWQGDGPGTGLPVGVMTALWNLVEHYAPGFLSHPASQNTVPNDVSPPCAGRTSCAMCCADMQSSNGTCDVCSTVLYEVSMNQVRIIILLIILHPMYQAHHTVGGNTRGAPSPPPQRTHMECIVPMSEDASSHGGGMRGTATITSAGAVYQRRAQFRMALASYWGRPSRIVPPQVVGSVRQLIETTASHLIDQICTLDNALQRYARITLVHVMCILCSTGSGKYSKWYRD